MAEIRELFLSDEKEDVCNYILRKLPRWFTMDAVIKDYVRDTQKLLFYAAYLNEKPVGFAALKIHNPYTAEVYVIGVLKEYHREGIGRQLIGCCETVCKEKKMEFLTVKTPEESRTSEGYADTRFFFHEMGFKPLEIFRNYWEDGKPCLFMVKSLV